MIIDSFTQIVLGAAVGEAVLGRKVGKKAAVWGAVCGTIPDLDVAIGWFINDLDKNIFHRSISHSLLFFILFSPVTGYLIHKVHRSTSVKEWSILAFWSYFTHALLDTFTTWGTQLLWPWNYRFAFKSIFVIDPLYTLPLLLFLILALKQDTISPKRKRYNNVGLFISSAYLILTLINKQFMNHSFEQAFAKQKINITRYETKPAPLNNLLWSVSAESDSTYLIGYRSFLDKNENVIFQSFSKNHQMLDDFQSHEEVQKIKRLTHNWYTVEQLEHGFKINDLRFGTNKAWEAGGEFVFSYIIEIKNDQIVSVKEGEKVFRDKPNIILHKLFLRILGKS